MTLEVPTGQNTVIIGSSGAGKSVTLKLVVGLLEADDGVVQVDGETVQEMDRDELAALRGRIGYVFQFAALFDSMTVAENIRLGLVRRKHSEEEIAARIAESLAVVDLSGTRTLPGRAVGRHAQAGRHRASDRAQAALHSLRRADHRPRSRHRRGDGPAHDADPRSRRHRARGHPRHAERLHGRRPHRHAARGRHPQVGTVDEIQATTDPVVRQFIEGRPDEIEPAPAVRRSTG